MLEVRNLHASYGKIPILHGIDLSVDDNQCIGVLGHNGMGKTTLLKTLIGLLPANTGEIIFNGSNITTTKSYERNKMGVGYIPQGREIFPKLTVLENLEIGAAMHVKSRREINHIIDEILGKIPRLEPILSRFGGVLSGGEQQILALGRSLCSQPSLLMLDEPTEGIQPSIVQEIIQILLELKKSSNLSIILVEQNLEFIASLSDRVHVIRRGKIAGEVPHENISNPEVIHEFLGMQDN